MKIYISIYDFRTKKCLFRGKSRDLSNPSFYRQLNRLLILPDQIIYILLYIFVVCSRADQPNDFEALNQEKIKKHQNWL